MMSHTASDYNLSRLRLGIVVAAVALLAVSVVAFPALLQAGLTALVFVTIVLAYGGMMFASSYVEEEQHFWYWSLSGWLTWLCLKS